MTNTDNKDTQIKAEIASEAYIVLTDAGDAYFIEGNTLHFFDSLSGNMIDAGLVVPEELLVGVYFCTNFHSVNHSYDRDSGVLDGWDVACTWELVWNKQQAAELKQLRADNEISESTQAALYKSLLIIQRKYEQLRAERVELIKVLRECQQALVNAFNRIHCLPRTTDTVLASQIDAIQGKALNCLKLTDSAQRVTNKEEE